MLESINDFMKVYEPESVTRTISMLKKIAKNEDEIILGRMLDLINAIYADAGGSCYRKAITLENVDDIIDKLIDDVQSKTIEFIQENYDKYDIKEYKEYMYQIISEKAWDIAEKILKNKYTINNDCDIDDIVNKIVKELDISMFDDVLSDILNYSPRVEDKLADIGMSQKDFI